MTVTYSSRAQVKSQLLGDNSNFETKMLPVPAGEDNLDVSILLMF